MVGFRKRDLERALEAITPLSNSQRADALKLMTRFYNGYLFKGADEPLYNPTQSLFFLDKLATGTADIDRLQAEDAAYVAQIMSDRNVAPSNTFLQLARSVSIGERAVTSLLGESAPLQRRLISQQFTVRDLINPPTVVAVQALLFHRGIATYADREFKSLKLPNEVVRHALFASLGRSVEFRDIDTLLRAPTASLLKEFLDEIVTSDDDAIETDAAFEFHVALALSRLCRPADIKMQLITTEQNRLDVLMWRGSTALVLALKCIPSSQLELKEQQQLDELSDADVLSLPTKVQSRYTPLPGDSTETRTVEHVVQVALSEARDQVQLLRQGGTLGIDDATTVHAFVVVLVGSRILVRSATKI